MPEETKPQVPIDPMELWLRWNDATTRMWSDIMGGGKETFMDPYGLYRSWFKSMTDMQEQMKLGTRGMIDPKEAWKMWFETTGEMWKKIAEMGTDPLGLTSRWLELMEDIRAKMLSGAVVPTEPFTFFKEWYDATSETWAAIVGDVIGTERFMESVKEFLENYTSFARSLRRFNEEYFRSLQLPTRSDIARVAELVVAVEDKVDEVEEMLEGFQDGYAKLATVEGVEEVAGHLTELENKLAKLATVEEVGNVAGRLTELENKLAALPAVVERVGKIESLEKRMDRVESKLDMLLASLDKLVTSENAHTSNVATGTRRRSQKAQAQVKETNGSESKP